MRIYKRWFMGSVMVSDFEREIGETSSNLSELMFTFAQIPLGKV